MEKIKSPTGILKNNLNVENVAGFGVNSTTTRGKNGQNFHENKCVQNSTKLMEKVKLQTEIIKIYLDVEKAGGLGLKTRMKKDKQGAKFTWKSLCPEFHKNNRKGQVTNKDYENYLRCWKCRWFRGEKSNEKGQKGGKIYMKINVSRIPPSS